MSQPRIAKLEALLSRVTGRRGEPRLQVVEAPRAPVLEVPVTASLGAAGDGAPPTPSVVSALEAIRSSALEPAALEPAALEPAPAAERRPEPAREFAMPRPAPVEPLSEPPADERLPSGAPAEVALATSEAPAEVEPDEPDEPTVAVRVPSLPQAVHPELTPAGDPTIPDPGPQESPAAEAPAAAQRTQADAPEPVLELVQPAPVEPRVTVAPPRMSLPVRPSLPSPELVPEALPFTLLTERPPALSNEPGGLDLSAISLTTAVTLVPSGGTTPPTFEPAVSIIPPAPAPALPEPTSGELEPDARAQHASEPAQASAVLEPELIHVALPSLAASAVHVVSAMPARAPLSFGKLLERSLALRPRG